jgi:hypothetical protein
VDPAGGPVDYDIEVALAPLTVGRLQLEQVFDVNVKEAEIVALEVLGRLVRRGGGSQPRPSALRMR